MKKPTKNLITMLVALLMAAALALACFSGCGKEKLDTASSSEGSADAVGLAGEWKAVVDEGNDICVWVSFSDNGDYSRYITIGGEKTVLNRASFKYVEGNEVAESGVINIDKHVESEYYPGIAKTVEVGNFWLSMTKSDMMLSEGIGDADIIISEKLDENGINGLNAGDIITYRPLIDGDMANTHKISEVITGADGKKSFVMKYPHPYYGEDGETVAAGNVLGKYVCVVYPEHNNVSLGDCPFEITGDGTELTLKIFQDTYVFKRG